MSGNINDPDWKIYEDLVCDALRQENPDLAIEQNIHVVGHLSKQRRQIDIALGKKKGVWLNIASTKHLFVHILFRL